MKRVFYIFRSFGAKIAVIFILAMFVAGLVSNFLIYEYALRSEMDQLRSRLMIIAQMIANTIDTKALIGIPLNEKGIESPQYKKIEKELMKIRDVAPSLAYIYILEKTDKECVFKFMIDLHAGTYRAENAPANPGEEYECSRFPELMKAFNGPSADRELLKDKWGVFLSGYAPIKDENGRPVAVLGIDATASDVYDMQREIRKRALLLLLLGIILSILIGSLVSGMIARPIGKLVEGTRHISAGELEYRVRIRGGDEIKELADSFNRMAQKLLAARRELLNYFYRVVQSLIRSLEAKDPYTSGHSDRVARYSEKIARKMGIDETRIQILKEAALLHDIGKVGIQDALLHKNTALSDEERGELRKHPLIGEDILKPVSIDKEILSIIRHHHERYDGTGYPDKLKGSQIDILASIVSVADAYDAMMSHRSYMKDFKKEEAIDQLRSNSGTQFNPEVVDVFIKILEKEK